MIGITASFACALLLTTKDLLSKFISFRIDGTTSTFASFAFALPFYLIAILIAWLGGYESFVFGSGFFLLVVLRSLTDSGAEWFKMQALSRGDISLLACFLYLSPVFVLVLSPFFLGDVISLQGAVGVVIVGAGGLILLKPVPGVGQERSGQGILLALASAFFFSLNHCLDKLAVERGSPLMCGFFMTALAALFFTPVLLRTQRRAALRANFRPLLGRGVFELAAMFAKLYALQFLPAAYVVALLRISLLFSIFGGVLFFKERDLGRRLVAGLITAAGVCIILLD